MQSRYYNPEWGRLLNADAIAGSAGELLGANVFVYCKNNPVLLVDKDGFHPAEWDENESDESSYENALEMRAKGEVLSGISNIITNNTSIGLSQILIAHYVTRSQLNYYAPTTEKGAKDAGWEKLSPKMSVYHQIGKGNESNVKYVSPNGKLEGVYKNGKVVSDPINMGTYNFCSPHNAIGHAVFDVLPYYIFGNTPDDIGNYQDRFNATIKSIMMK